MRHFVIVGVVIAVITPLIYLGIAANNVMPIQASVQALPVDWMWNVDAAAMAFLFSLIMVPLLYSLVVFRRRKGDVGDAEHSEGNTRLEIAWTVVPLLVVSVFAYLGAYTLGETRIAAPDAKEIGVTALQWDWRFEYPEGFASNELHLPVNRQVVLRMQSLDVIHSFWVPEFRIKQDVLPGRVTEYRITPIRVGRYTVRCAEMCGASHSYMERPVIVSSQADYDAWVRDQAAAAAALLTQGGPDSGKALVSQNGCLACHSVDGTALSGPTWRGLYGSNVELSDGSTVVADVTYLIASIEDPGAQVALGFQPGIMPQYSLTEAQVNDIVSYLQTLK
ncbi:MAG: cytochrome c oxidase subunit II [Chloroflexota bacterium]